MNDEKIYDIAKRLDCQTRQNNRYLKRKGIIGASIKIMEELQNQYAFLEKKRETGNVGYQVEMVNLHEKFLDKLFGNEKK